MKKTPLIIMCNLLFAGVLAYGTYGAVEALRGTQDSELFGWLNLAGAGVGVSAAVMLLFVLFITIDVLWLFFFITWAAKKKLHIKDDDHTLYLP